MKKLILFVFFSLLFLTTKAQLNYNARTVRFTAQDTANCGCPLVRGTVMRQSNTDSLYMYLGLSPDSVGTHWRLIAGGSSGVVGNANNGVTLLGDTVQLGGTLLKDTDIDSKTHGITFSTAFVDTEQGTIGNHHTEFYTDSTQINLVNDAVNENGSTSYFLTREHTFRTGGLIRLNIDTLGNVLFPNSKKFAVYLTSGSGSSIFEMNSTGTSIHENNELNIHSTANAFYTVDGDAVFDLNGSTGNSGQGLLSDGSGNTVWGDVVTNPAGSNTEIQFNNSGVFGASNNVNWDGSAFNIGLTTDAIHINNNTSIDAGNGTDLISSHAFSIFANAVTNNIVSNSLNLSGGANVFAGSTGGNVTISAGSGILKSGNITIDTDQSLTLGNHSATLISLYGVAATTQGAVGATLTNNVTAGGSTGVIADFTSLTVYATDATTIRNDIYQLTLKVAALEAKLKLLGAVKN